MSFIIFQNPAYVLKGSVQSAPQALIAALGLGGRQGQPGPQAGSQEQGQNK